MGNKTSQNVGPSKIEAVSDNVDVKFKGRLLCVDGSTQLWSEHWEVYCVSGNKCHV